MRTCWLAGPRGVDSLEGETSSQGLSRCPGRGCGLQEAGILRFRVPALPHHHLSLSSSPNQPSPNKSACWRRQQGGRPQWRTRRASPAGRAGGPGASGGPGRRSRTAGPTPAAAPTTRPSPSSAWACWNPRPGSGGANGRPRRLALLLLLLLPPSRPARPSGPPLPVTHRARGADGPAAARAGNGGRTGSRGAGSARCSSSAAWRWEAGCWGASWRSARRGSRYPCRTGSRGT